VLALEVGVVPEPDTRGGDADARRPRRTRGGVARYRITRGYSLLYAVLGSQARLRTPSTHGVPVSWRQFGAATSDPNSS
jgi:hypothetical protein